MSVSFFWWWIDPGGCRQFFRRWALAFEAAGVGGKGHVQGLLARRDEFIGEAMVNAVRCHVGNAAVAVLVVVPVKEGLAMSAGVLD